MIEDGQPVCKLTFERMLEAPTALYGPAIGSSYQQQTDPLGKQFLRPVTHEAADDTARPNPRANALGSRAAKGFPPTQAHCPHAGMSRTQDDPYYEVRQSIGNPLWFANAEVLQWMLMLSERMLLAWAPWVSQEFGGTVEFEVTREGPGLSPSYGSPSGTPEGK